MAGTDLSLAEAYRGYDIRLRTRRLIIACIISSVGILSGVFLDFVLYPALLVPFFLIRLGAVGALLLLVLRLLAGKNLGLAEVKTLGVLSALVMNFSFCLMIFQAEGARSPYFSALNLIIMAMATMLPWTVVETAVMCAGSLMLYIAACLANPSFQQAGTFPVLAYNVSFIVITTAVCITITYFLSLSRFEEFRLRHQLDLQNRELQDLDKVKTRFFSNISHELRTPLTLILGPVEALLSRGGELDGRVHEGLILVHRNALRLLKLINDLLDLMRLEQGAEILRKRNLSLGAFLKGIVDSVKHLGLSKNLKIRVENGNEDTVLIADPARMEKVMLNLLTNAIKYTPSSGSVTVRWLSNAKEVRIEVSDTGVGIPPSDLEKIFDRFHQVRGNASNQVQGVGIGLALAKDLVTEHGGRIEVESAMGRGSKFSVVLPRCPELEDLPVEMPGDSDEEEPFQKAFRSADRTWRNPVGQAAEVLPVLGSSGEVVLVADDESDMLHYIVSLLSGDFRVVQTRSGDQVAGLVAEHEPRIVILDWMMPGRDGLEICRELRANPELADLKIMLLTARIDEDSKIQALSAGADDFLTKPFSSVEVRTRVSNLLRSARLQKELRTRNTELSETVDKLRRTETMLIHSEKLNALGTLSAGLLHEINNPLNYTLTAVSMARQSRDEMAPPLVEILADIEEGMHRILDVTTHLKDFACPEQPGGMTVFPLLGAFHSARKILANELEGISWDVGIPETLLIRGQKTQITHVLMNLLSNAGKALAELPPGAEKRVAVRAESADGRVTIEVSDTGCGIPAAVLGRIFEPFFTTRDVGAGMGMGLSICHTILEGHRGTIQAGSNSGGGAVFTITLPQASESEQYL